MKTAVSRWCHAIDGSQSGALFSAWVNFEFDPAKSRANREKHGIDFVAAQALWQDVNRLEVPVRLSQWQSS